jgi:thioredoxin-related protein
MARLPRLVTSAIPLDADSPMQHPRCAMNLKITTLCAIMVALHGTALAGGEGWTSDFAAAKKQAAESKKDLLIDFTGSDWCSWCIKLNDEVFKLEPFKAGVKDTFVLVEIDSPKDKTKLSEETQKQNTELGKKYAVQGYPTILLCDADGRPYAKAGYQPGGPEKYVAELNELRAIKVKRDEAFATAAKSKGLEKAKALIAALDAMKLQDELVANWYGEITEQILAADTKDEFGFAKKAAAKKRLTDFQKNLQELGSKNDMDGVLALIDKTLKEGGFEKEDTLQMMMIRASVFAQQQKFDEAIKAVDAAKAFAPDSPMIERINGFRKRLEDEKKKAADTPAKEPAKEPAKAAE